MGRKKEEEKYEYYEKVDDSLRYLLACKLNNFKTPSTQVEKYRILRLADEWIKEHPGEHINLYR